jgi:alcohol dehydrogenase
MTLVVENLPVVLKDPGNKAAREALSFAAMLGGMAFTDALTHLGHCIGQSIGAVKHLTHGTTCALGGIIILDFLGEAIPDKTRRVGEILGLKLDEGLSGAELGKQVSGGFAAFTKSVGLPTTLSEAGITEDDLEKIAALIAAEPMLQMASPKKVDAGEALSLLKKAF